MKGSNSTVQAGEGYRGTLLIRNPPPPRITIGPWAKGYFRILRGGCFL